MSDLILAAHRAQVERDERWIEVLDELYEALRRNDLFERGLAVVRVRNQEGWRGKPDGRCDEAEMLLRLGRRPEATALLEACWDAGDDPWWVGNNAGMAFADASEHEPAVEWLGRGIETAMAAGDPEQLVAQMCDLRRISLEQLGRPPADLQAAGEGFADRSRRRDDAHEERARVLGEALLLPPGVRSASIAMAWFPEAEYESAHAIWPDGLDRFTGVGHHDYCRTIEAEMRAFTRAGVRVSHTAAVTVAAVTAYAATIGVDPASPNARSGVAAQLAGRGEAAPWPPGRNDPCWCGRPAKYKRCCGTVEVDPVELADAVEMAERYRRLAQQHDLPDVVDATRRLPPAARMRAALDGLRSELAHLDGAAESELDDEFGEFVSDVLYSHALDLVRESPTAPADELLEQMRDVFDHDVVAGSLRRNATVRLMLAEALAMSDRPDAAWGLAGPALADLAAEGARVPTATIALATGYLVGTGEVAEALERFDALLAERPDDGDEICEIAGEALSEHGYPRQSLAWFTLGVERALERTPDDHRLLHRTVAALRRTSAAAGVEPDPELIRRVADALGIKRSDAV